MQRATTLSHAHKQRTKNNDASLQVQQQLQAIQARNQDIITYQPHKQHRLMNKMGWLFTFIIFLIMAGLFFASGFITCYIAYPPRPVNLTSDIYNTQQSPDIQNSFGNNAIIVDNQTVSNSYFQRQKMLKSLNRVTGNAYISSAIDQSKNQASQAAHNAFDRVLEEWSQSIRNALGPIFGGAITPLTTGLARSAVDHTLTSNYGTNYINTGDKVLPNTSQPSAPEPMVPVTTGHYSIQIQNFNNSNSALDLARELKAKHYSAYVVRLSTPTGMQFSVRAGSFSNYREAQAAASTLTRMWNQPTHVITTDNNDIKPKPDNVGS